MIASLSFSLDPNGPPRYLQLQQQLLAAIEQGRLVVGDKLPSSRILANSLGVSRSVVVQTYDQLIAEGVLISEPKRGVFVADMQRVAPTSMPSVASDVVQPYEAFDSGIDVAAFPSKEWAASMRRAWLNPDANLLTGGFRFGYPALQRAVAAYLYALRGLECLPEQIIMTAGSRDALALLSHVLRSDTERWALESPTYPPIRASFSHLQVCHLPVTQEGCLPPKDAHWAAVLTPCRQYPLGISYSSPVREQWLDALAQGRGYIIEDDYDNEFLYQGKMQVPLMQLAKRRGVANERVFYVGSFSKVLFRGLRMGFIVAPLAQLDRVLQSQQKLGLSASLPIQPVIADFMENGSFYRHLNRMRRHYRYKRDYLITLLEQYLQPWFEWEKPSGGMHIIARVRPHWVAQAGWCEALEHGARQRNLKLMWLQQHYPNEDVAPAGLVLGFSGPSEQELARWISVIATVANTISDSSLDICK
ncbi:PLP-dependent aminotransferase family protein [Marinomonas piezotolerans]|uniref:PLP-dependent aminotransferase family protein n=1 Tax=Marinomonas piezotolerans TaxID=2213058 RepID=A0A370UB92_9GAMM|nr:PLP-dependent aminotransferase family protein [Marinomonas piezotolerans]RDL45054.1 PLP-dependent aminotransferase family protein [Marinomonas piezotolerans]